MGYYTNYELVAMRGEVDDNFITELRALTGYDEFFGYASTGEFYVNDVKWYKYNEHMIEISQRYPNLVFRLRGNGEEAGDIWQTFYKNGKRQHWKLPLDVIYPEYDENLLER
jgi:hypothetical protein